MTLLLQTIAAVSLATLAGATQSNDDEPVERGLVRNEEGALPGYTIIAPLRADTIYLVKFLVFSSGYSMSRYVLAIAVGRLPRFYLLALLGVVVRVPVWLMVAIFSAIFAVYIFFIVRGIWRARVVRRDPIRSELRLYAKNQWEATG